MVLRVSEHFLIAVVLLVSTWLLPAPAAGECSDVAEVKASEYWCAEGRTALHNAHHDGPDMLATVDQGCVRVPAEALEDSIARSQGYRCALETILAELQVRETQRDRGAAANTSGRYLALLSAVPRLTGRHFATVADAAAWLETNGDYLLWSAKSGHLVIDTVARDAGEPLRFHYHDGDPRAFWYNWAMGRATRLVETATAAFGAFRTGSGAEDRIVIDTDSPDARAMKETAVRGALGVLVYDYTDQVQVRERSAPEQCQARLAALTGETFTSAQEWEAWWLTNRLALRWSDERGIMTVEPALLQADAPLPAYVRKSDPVVFWHETLSGEIRHPLVVNGSMVWEERGEHGVEFVQIPTWSMGIPDLSKPPKFWPDGRPWEPHSSPVSADATEKPGA